MDFARECSRIRQLLDDQSKELSKDAAEQQLTALLAVLGEPDAQLRDAIGYATLRDLFRSGLVSAHSRITYLKRLMTDQFMFHQIHEGEESAAAVKRSFAVLAMSDLIFGDAHHSRLMGSPLLGMISEKLCEYLELEKDQRGFDEDLGFIHCLAHAADCFLALDQHPNLALERRIDNVLAILTFVERREFAVFEWDEHFRLGRPIASALCGLAGSQILDRFFGRYTPEYLLEAPCRQNLLNMLRCVYLELTWADAPSEGTFDRLAAILR